MEYDPLLRPSLQITNLFFHPSCDEQERYTAFWRQTRLHELGAIVSRHPPFSSSELKFELGLAVFLVGGQIVAALETPPYLLLSKVSSFYTLPDAAMRRKLKTVLPGSLGHLPICTPGREV